MISRRRRNSTKPFDRMKAVLFFARSTDDDLQRYLREYLEKFDLRLVAIVNREIARRSDESWHQLFERAVLARQKAIFATMRRDKKAVLYFKREAIKYLSLAKEKRES